MNEKKIKILIIGAGSIAALKDEKYDSPTTEAVITHAHSCFNNSEVDLCGIVDIDIEKMKKASDKWNTNGYVSIDTAISEEKPDIVIVCTPTETHFEVISQIATHPAKKNNQFLILEKPMGLNLKEAEQIESALRITKTKAMVGYLRRHNRTMINIQKSIETGMFGKIYNCRITYTRGFIRDACHAIDICRFFFGEFKDGMILNPDHAIFDYSAEDPTYNAFMSFDRCSHVDLAAVDGRKYDVFDIEIWTETGKILITEHGKTVKYFKPIPEPTYGNYNTLDLFADTRNTYLHKTMLDELNDAILLWKGEEIPHACTVKDAVECQKIIKYLLNNKWEGRK